MNYRYHSLTFLFSVLLSLSCWAGIGSDNAAYSAADYSEETCSLTLPTPYTQDGCARVDFAPYSNYGPVEFMWARNDNGNVSDMTGWSTTQTLLYCPTQSGFYRLCARVVGCSQIYESPDTEVNVNPCGSLTGIYIYDQTTDEAVVGPLTNGQQISSDALPSNYYLVAETTGNIESVSWDVDGYTLTENQVLYTFPGGAENGSDWAGGVGTHNIDANAYSQDNAGGSHCDQIWLSFEIIDGCDNITWAGTISGDETVCIGETVTISNIQLPTGGSGDIEYIWLFNMLVRLYALASC